MSAALPFPLAGNHAIRQQLGDGSRLSHAYILSGETGSGRHTLARYLTGLLMCSAPGSRPCGVCSNCRKAAAGIHPDVFTLAPADGKKEIQVDEVRKMRSDAYIRPNEAERKLYLIENAGAMNEKAQNTVLKLIEDGPEYAAFLFLVGHAGELLPTIRSRCEELKLTPLSQAECQTELARRFPDRTAEALESAARSCRGILGRGIALLSQESGEDPEVRAWAEEFCQALADRDELALGRFLAQRDKASRDALSAFCQRAQMLVQQALVCRAGASRETLSGAVLGLAQNLRGEQLLKLHRLLEAAQQRLAGNGGAGHCLGWLVVSCVEAIS